MVHLIRSYTCTNLWTNWIFEIVIITDITPEGFQLWTHKLLVKWQRKVLLDHINTKMVISYNCLCLTFPVGRNWYMWITVCFDETSSSNLEKNCHCIFLAFSFTWKLNFVGMANSEWEIFLFYLLRVQDFNVCISAPWDCYIFQYSEIKKAVIVTSLLLLGIWRLSNWQSVPTG